MSKRNVITLRRRPRWGRVLYAPRHFWLQLQVGKGRVKLRQRFMAAWVLTKPLIQKEKSKWYQATINSAS